MHSSVLFLWVRTKCFRICKYVKCFDKIYHWNLVQTIHQFDEILIILYLSTLNKGRRFVLPRIVIIHSENNSSCGIKFKNTQIHLDSVELANSSRLTFRGIFASQSTDASFLLFPAETTCLTIYYSSDINMRCSLPKLRCAQTASLFALFARAKCIKNAVGFASYPPDEDFSELFSGISIVRLWFFPNEISCYCAPRSAFGILIRSWCYFVCLISLWFLQLCHNFF